ncbi:MAG: HAD family hydrolase, partial [Bryobacteraceae bacterium]
GKAAAAALRCARKRIDTRDGPSPMDLLIFDLDGTLIDSKLDLANSVNATLAHLGRQSLPNQLVYSYVGNGVPALMQRALGGQATEEEVQTSVEYFLAYYRDHMLDFTILYPGVRPALDRLREARMKMSVLTNKPVNFSTALIAGLGLSGHFFRIYGGNSFPEKKPSPAGVEALLSESGAARERAMMVGDSAVDVRTARNARVRACGVTYGFQPETFQNDPPDILVDTLEELAEAVISGNGR